MNPVVAVVVSVASYLAVFTLGCWYGLRWSRKDMQAINDELWSSAAQAAECYRLGYELGFNLANDVSEEDPRWSSN